MKKNILAVVLIWMYIYTSSPASTYAQDKEDLLNDYHKPLFDFDYREPLFILSKEQKSNNNRFLRYSALSGYREGVKPIEGLGNFSGYTDTISHVRKVYMYNLSIEDMFTHGLLKANAVLLEVNDPSNYRYHPSYGPKEAWMRKHAYCYELLLPEGTIRDIKLVEDDLSYLFGVKYGEEMRKVKATVLYRTSKIDKIKSAEKGERGYDMNGHFNNVPIDRLGHPIYEAGLPPFVNETGYTGMVDLNLNIKSWQDMKSLRAELQKYDLDLKVEIRNVKMFVIREVSWNKKKAN